MDESARQALNAPLSVGQLLEAGIALARLMAVRHTAGDSGGISGLTRSSDGALCLGPVVAQPQTDDVRDIARLLLEAPLRRLPPRRPISDEHLLSHMCLMRPDLPPELAAVLADAISPDPQLRPPDATALWARLASAAATDAVRADAPLPRHARWQLSHDTHIGMYKSRLGQTNQDALLYLTEGDLVLLVVADGISISTAGSGDLASALLIQAVAALWEQEKSALQSASEDTIFAFLCEALRRANTAICEGSIHLAGGRLHQHIPMGTTAVIGLMRGAEVWLANLGDSRAYLISPCGAGLLTGDQNLRGEWLRSWQSDDPIELTGEGHALTGYVGHFDLDGTPAVVPPTLRRLRVLPGETLLLCSDGLTDYGADSHATISEMILQALADDDLSAAARRLVERANIGGGGDNITVLLARQGGL